MKYGIGSIFYSTLTSSPLLLINTSVNIPGRAIQDTYGIIALDTYDMYCGSGKTAVEMEEFIDKAFSRGSIYEVEGDRR